MIILAIETAIGTCGVALVKDGFVLAEITSAESHKQAELLPEMLGAVLDKAGINFSDIGKISVNIGPGSFTGIRIGLAFAEGIATAHKIPLIPVTSLEAMAHGFSGNLVAVQEAMRGDCYFQEIGGSEAKMIAWSDLANNIKAGAFVVSTNPEKVPVGNWKIYENSAFPTASKIAIIAAGKQPSPTIPYYIRPPDAKPQQV
jgi:tRNA threonylcarbamoyladenosine biosynthesis protein TsaB